LGEYVGEYAFQFGLALIVLTAATAAWILSRRGYVNSADFKQGMGVLRLEFKRSIEEARAVTSRKATVINDKLLSVIKPIESTVTDLNVRLARLEEHADAVETFMAGPQKQALEENERIGTRLRRLEQRLDALPDQHLLIEQTIEAASVRDQERNNSIEVINSRLMNTQKQVDELFPRLELGEKARADLGTLISLFVKQLKRVDINSAETVLRVADLESLRSKVTGLEERLSSILDREKCRLTEDSTRNINNIISDATPKAGDEVGSIETNNGSENASIRERPPTSTEDAPHEPSIQGRSRSDNSSADRRPT
jgi:chromosome segregation ATPase